MRSFEHSCLWFVEKTKCCPSLEVWQDMSTLRGRFAVTLTGLQMSENLLVTLAQEGDDASGC